MIQEVILLALVISYIGIAVSFYKQVTDPVPRAFIGVVAFLWPIVFLLFIFYWIIMLFDKSKTTSELSAKRVDDKKEDDKK